MKVNFTQFALSAVGVAFAGVALQAQTARLQVIHNCADLAAATVDVRVNGGFPYEEYDNLNFREATPFQDVPAGVELTVTVNAPDSEDDSNALFTKVFTLEENESYIVVAQGIVSATGYEPGADERPFDLVAFAPAQEAAAQAGNTDVLVFHGATDAPTVDLNEVSVPVPGLVDDISFGEFAGYLELGTLDYVLDLTLADGETVVARYAAPLETLGLDDAALIALASGFLNPAANSDGEAFGIYVALPTGGDLLALPQLLLNDQPCGAIEVATDGSSNLLSNEGATADEGEPAPDAGDCGTTYQSWCAQNELENSVWVKFIAPASGAVDVNTCNEDTDMDTQIAVYEVGDCADYSTFSLLSANDDANGGCGFFTPIDDGFYSSFLTVCGLTPGEEYYIQIDGWNGSEGAFDINVTERENCNARVQIVHNAADLAAAVVDVRVNGGFPYDEYNDLAFRTATPYQDVPGLTDLAVTINAPDSEDDSNPLFSADLFLLPGQTYLVAAQGIVSGSGYDPGADEAGFDLLIVEGVLEASGDADQVAVAVVHGATDAPAVDVNETTVPAPGLFEDLAYGAVDGYVFLDEADYVLDIAVAGTSTVAASFEAPLATLGLGGTAITVFASGFLNPAVNSDGPAFGLWVALPGGGDLVPLPAVVSVDEVDALESLQMFPNPVAEELTVNYSLEGARRVAVDVFDVAGKRVFAEDLGVRSAGANTYRFNANNLSNGFYLMTLSIDGQQVTRKIQVAR